MKIVKKILLFILFMNIVNYAVAVSDNDGSAFITKAEFDSLKNDFQSQINMYNQSIDSKIDDAIASYLKGITVSVQADVRTAFSVIGNEPSTISTETIRDIEFFGKDMIPEYSDNIPYTSSNISWVGTIGYGPQEMWVMDANNTLQVKGVWNDGEVNNKVLVSDNGYVESLLTDVRVKENRTSAAQARHSEILWAGGAWKSIALTATEPTEAQVNQWTTTTTAPCLNGTFECRGINSAGAYGVDNPWERKPGTPYHWVLGKPAWYRLRNDTMYNFFIGYGAPNIYYLATSYTCSYSYNQTLNVNYHWPFGSDNQVMVKRMVKDSSGNETKKGHYTWGTSSTEFTKSRPFSIATGLAVYVLSTDSNIRNISTNEITIDGVTPHLNCNLNDPVNYKYKRIKTIWDLDAKMAGGLLLMDTNAAKDGTLEIQFKSDTNDTWLYFKDTQFTSKPNENDTNNIECEIYDDATSTYVKTYNPKLVTSGKTYKIKIPIKNNESVYLGLSHNNSDSGYDITLSQVGTAQITYSN